MFLGYNTNGFRTIGSTAITSSRPRLRGVATVDHHASTFETHWRAGERVRLIAAGCCVIETGSRSCSTPAKTTADLSQPVAGERQCVDFSQTSSCPSRPRRQSGPGPR